MSSTQSPAKRVVIAYPSKVPPAKRAKIEPCEYSALVVAKDRHDRHEELRKTMVDAITRWADGPKRQNEQALSAPTGRVVEPVKIFRTRMARERRKHGDKPIPKSVVTTRWIEAKDIAAHNQAHEVWRVPRPVPTAEAVDELIARVLEAVGESKDPVSDDQLTKAKQEHRLRLRAQMPATPPSIE